MAGLFEKSSLSSPWKELFADVAQLNEYQQQGHTVELQNTRVENYNLAGARFDKAKFADTDWKNIIAKGATFSNTTFRNCKLDQVRFEEATLKDVTFDHCEFTKVSFFRAQLLGVRFINCTLKDKTTFQASTNGTITFENATMNDVKFYKAQAAITVKDSKINDGDFTSMQAPSSLIFEKSELKEVNTDRSALTLLRVVSSRIDATFKNTKIDRMEFENSELDTSLSESEITSLIVASSKIKTLRMNSVKMDSVVIRECEHTKNFGFYKATVRKIDIEKSRLSDFDMAKTSVETLRINDSTLSNSDFEELRVKSATLEKVTLDGKVDFTNARIDQFVAKNITKLPSLNLITTGSNVKFSD